MSRAWYQLAMASPDASSAIGLVAAQGDHLGEAIAAAEKAHSRRIVVGARQISAAPLGESVGRSRHVVEEVFPAELAGLAALRTPGFRFPAGVVAELTALEGLWGKRPGPGYVVLREGALSIVEAQVPGEDLGEAFLSWIEKLPAADNLEIRLLHHFEERDTTDVWLTPRIGVKQVLRFLDAHDRELIDSGMVELAVYLREEGSTLHLSEHKTLVWTSTDESTVARTEKFLASLKVPRVDALVTIDRAPHFHTRPTGTKGREALAKYLLKQRMRLVDRLDRHGQSVGPPAAAAAKS